MSLSNRLFNHLELTFRKPAADSEILCSDSNGKEVAVSLVVTADNGNCIDNSYILPMLSPGCRINVLSYRVNKRGVIEPEIIIYNPDYLVDITTVTSCFESYGNTHKTLLVKRLRESEITQPIVLGNFAGELLDQTVHCSDGEQVDYPTAVTDFFCRSGLEIAAIDDFRSATFHSEARSQVDNIRYAISKKLPALFPGISGDRLILEPTFFCEILGIQGRMDMISDDFSLIVEQKSGKGEYGSSESHPKSRFAHLMQVLLYRAIIAYSHLNPGKELNSYLLYSKYTEPLILQKEAPEAIRMAMQIRNNIVFQDEQLAAKGGYDILDRITVSDINVANAGGAFWETYVKPKITSVLTTYGSASEIEKLYVKRLLEFTAREHLEAKTGYDTVTLRGGFSSAWTRPLEERITQGQIYCGMEISELKLTGSGKVSDIVLTISENQQNEAANFRVGDIVALYSYKTDSFPDIRKGIVFRATVADFGSSTITLHLRANQPARLFEPQNILWAIEPDFYESSFARTYRNIFAFLKAPADRRKLILQPETGAGNCGYVPEGDYGCFSDMVANALGCNGIYAVIGPPGTGKTSLGLMNVLKEELTHKNSSVLLTAYTNRAVDEICGKLADAEITFIRLGTGTSADSRFSKYMIGENLRACKNITDLKNMMRTTRVFVGTTHAAGGSPLLRIRTFSLAIIDEASQILEPQLLGLLAATSPDGRPAIRRFLLIGDHKQLPAVVSQKQELSIVDDIPLRDIGLSDLRNSFFERFLKRATLADGTYDPRLVYTFRHQGRMHGEVADFPSKMFYDGNLNPVPLPHQLLELEDKPVSDKEIGTLLNKSRTIFIPVNPPEEFSGNVNIPEAEMAARIVHEIYFRENKEFEPEKTIGIIVPYRMQGAAIKRLLKKTGISELEDITIDTVERFQGGQRKYIIFTTTVSTPRQLCFLTSSRFTDTSGTVIDRKLNVALTRAHSHNIVIGNPALLRTDPIYSRLISTFKE